MNRIILIGNGFDLAHGLKTSYKDFIDWFWEETTKKIKVRIGKNYEDDFLSVSSGLGTWYSTHGNTNYQDLLLNLKKVGIRMIFKNSFLEIITQKKNLQDWVDIEEEYYQQIKNIVKNYSQYYKNIRGKGITKLNDEFENIKKELEKYLTNVANNSKPKIDEIYDIFYENFMLQDFPSRRENLLIEYTSNTIIYNDRDDNGYYRRLRDEIIKIIMHEYKIDISDVAKKHINEFLTERDYRDYYLSKTYPQNVLLLNFNYTNTEFSYSKYEDYKKSKFLNYLPFLHIDTIHIHGELKNENNPIIFGYGDELADEYKEIEKLYDKDYFKNVKSIKYTKTKNYRELLNFIGSDYYQIYILGHSCGNSDRTLLNTLFEHENCVSIKPFFYEKEENGKKTDDYEDIIINMSRNFNDKKAFREKVANRTYCRPLPQMQK